MAPKHLTKFVLPLLVLVTLLALDQTAQACGCPDGDDSTLGKFQSARFVVVNRIVSVNTQQGFQTVYSGGETRQEPITNITSITTIVEKVYKGNLKTGDVMTFGQGDDADCTVSFLEKEAGAKFLFYLKPKEVKPKLWYADSCGGSKPLPNYPTNHIEDAAADLLYLDKIKEVRGKTRISGTLISYQWTIGDGSADFKRVAGRKVQILGNGRTYEAITNEDGVYEIYDLPVGTYTIKPEGKQGWAMDTDHAFGGFSSGTNDEDGSAQVNLKAGRHAYSDFVFKVENRIRGKVLDALGRPLPWVCLRLLPTQTNVSKDFDSGDCADADGRFEIEEIPFASYVVVVNDDDKISSRQPFRRVYYPGVTDREKAQVVTIVEGVTEYPLDIHVPEVSEVVTITGKVLTADSKPVVSARVGFTSAQTDPAIDGSAFTRTDQQGSFSVNVLKGFPGDLRAFVRLEPTEFKKCPALLRVGGETSLDRTTEVVRVQADRGLDGVDLKLSIPSCNQEKIHSQIRVD